MTQLPREFSDLHRQIAQARKSSYEDGYLSGRIDGMLIGISIAGVVILVASYFFGVYS